MSFYNLGLKNFKRFENDSVDLTKSITLLLGPNSSGKSSIIKSLLGLKQTVTSSNEHESFAAQGEYVDLGNFKDYVFQHDTRRPITITIGFSLTEEGGIWSLFDIPKSLTVDLVYDFDFISQQARILEIRFLSCDELKRPILNLTRKKTRNSYLLTLSKYFADNIIKSLKSAHPAIDKWNKGQTLYHHEKFRFSTTLKSSRNIESGIKLDDLPFHLFERLLNQFTKSIDNELFYLGPLRKSPARSYTRTSHNINVGPNGEHTPSIFANLEKRSKKVTHGKSEIRENFDALNEWLEIIFPNRVISTTSYEELVKVTVLNKTTRKNKTQENIDVLSDVGFGFSQIFPILVQAAVMPSGSTLIIEQPELHLHPMAQSRLAIVIAKASRLGKKFIIETHSEHFLRGLQLEVSEHNINQKKGIDANQLQVIYVPEYPKKLMIMEINKWGEIETEWPSGFFDEAYKLALALMQNKSKSLKSEG